MKPADFFLGSRQFFGFLIPGVVWLIAIMLIFVDASIPKLLDDASDARVVEALSFLAVALVLGMLSQDRSFGFSRMVSRQITKLERVQTRNGPNQRGNRLPHWLLGQHLAPKRYRAELRRHASQLIRDKYSHARVPVRLYFDPADRYYQGERQIFTLCKRAVLSRSQELGRVLKEKEDEINLVGMLPLPLALFTVGLLVHTPDFSKLPLRGEAPWLWPIGIVFFAIVAVPYLLIRFHQLRNEEFRVCIETFLALESGLAMSSTPLSGPMESKPKGEET